MSEQTLESLESLKSLESDSFFQKYKLTIIIGIIMIFIGYMFGSIFKKYSSSTTAEQSRPTNIPSPSSIPTNIPSPSSIPTNIPSPVSVPAPFSPVIETFPNVPLVSDNMNGYVISASSTYVCSTKALSGQPICQFAYNAFDESNETYWNSNFKNANNKYSLGSGFYDGSVFTNVIGMQYPQYGEWLQIMLPKSISIVSFQITLRQSGTRNDPARFIVVGSTNGTSWSVVMEISQDINWVSNPQIFRLNTPSKMYRYFRLIITKVGKPGVYFDSVNISDWKLFGF